ncbi:DUF4864 domain-containing protein [Roseobacter sp. HKCCD5988]|uniref:DUF4864 domain-containing protein n=1 Tax=Roseobacter sp. HKCCD5988 TaxID=3120338 RepID=UPI0030EF3A2D
MIRHYVITLILVLGVGLAGAPRSALAQSAPEIDNRVEATIAAQLEAFRAQDIPRAWSYASPLIQNLFGDQDQFARMVEQGYPMVWHPLTYRFGAARVTQTGVFQQVEVIDRDWQSHLLIYEMVQIAGDWWINGVHYMPQPPASV